MSEEMAQEIVEAILTKLSGVPVVGDALEVMSNEAYDKLEAEMEEIVFSKIAETRVGILLYCVEASKNLPMD